MILVYQEVIFVGLNINSDILSTNGGIGDYNLQLGNIRKLNKTTNACE